MFPLIDTFSHQYDIFTFFFSLQEKYDQYIAIGNFLKICFFICEEKNYQISKFSYFIIKKFKNYKI